MDVETKRENKDPGKEPAMEKVEKEERATQEMGRGPRSGAEQEGPHGQGQGRERKRDKEQEKENKGAVGVNSPSPQPP